MRSLDGSLRQEKRESIVKTFVRPNKAGTAGNQDRENPMVMLLSLQVSFPAVSHVR